MNRILVFIVICLFLFCSFICQCEVTQGDAIVHTVCLVSALMVILQAVNRLLSKLALDNQRVSHSNARVYNFIFRRLNIIPVLSEYSRVLLRSHIEQ